MLWLLIVLVESLLGLIRHIFLVPYVGDLLARQIGVGTGSLAILIITWFGLSWIGTSQPLRIGAVWLLLMLSFEFGLGLLLGMSTQALLANYRPTQGGYMGLGMLILLLAPWLVVQLKRFKTA